MPNLLTRKANRPVWTEVSRDIPLVSRDISLVHDDKTRMRREMNGVHQLMRTPH